jgi:hypothetical protein
MAPGMTAGAAIVETSTITCPLCGAAARETMPKDACRVFYECRGCGAVLRPKTGDCCVFCSYGSVPCPPIQAERAGAVLRAGRRRLMSGGRPPSWQRPSASPDLRLNERHDPAAAQGEHE